MHFLMLYLHSNLLLSYSAPSGDGRQRVQSLLLHLKPKSVRRSTTKVLLPTSFACSPASGSAFLASGGISSEGTV
ncbi:hypothetical protein BD324DRAFT_623516 [Kockovaella imperatae]|uniref:Secreted protein n=1 Tax=Kockovaella imperatae TaxID=4999 RepID=A0A1Y1UK16_9TREE|nr:hypothetical protein BD324DRAFT_623516 [Kockovaella imperatae]ORX37844.1 hypothetical protein BD324DRAFT_623516 [Kockovaella imperatae]